MFLQKKLKVALSLTLVLVLVLSLFTGCGNSNKTGDESTKSSSGEASTIVGNGTPCLAATILKSSGVGIISWLYVVNEIYMAGILIENKPPNILRILFMDAKRKLL